jgi:hypothetical protein
VEARTPPRYAASSRQAVSNFWRYLRPGMLAGLAMRLTGRFKDQALLNEAVLYLHALERGCIVLTRNLADFDVFRQLVPTGGVLLYRQA